MLLNKEIIPYIRDIQKNTILNMKAIKPLFMWAGGKNKMIKNYLAHMPEKVSEYSEPFFGGGAMYIYIQQNFAPEKCYINDSNEGIIEIYRSIKNNAEGFIEILKKYDKKYIPLSKEDRKKLYYEVRLEHAYDYQKWSKLEESAALYFLMKTGFNGLWQINQNTNNRYGTPSGLLEQKETCFDYDNILEWNKLLQNTEIFCGDWKGCPYGDFTFFDPPYRDSFTKYGTGWGDKESEELIDLSRNKEGLVFICNRDDGTQWINDRSENYSIKTFPIVYTAGRRKKTDDGFKAKAAIEVLMIKK